MLIHGICLSYANPMQVKLFGAHELHTEFYLNWAFEVNFKEDTTSIYKWNFIVIRSQWSSLEMRARIQMSISVEWQSRIQMLSRCDRILFQLLITRRICNFFIGQREI